MLTWFVAGEDSKFYLALRGESYFRLDFFESDVFLLLIEFIDYLSDTIRITVGRDYAL
ncbi:MAG: hypothetical protein SD837_04900 [Candidatus Electrothrix scaldis]|nr:MAG: hypothetical protein SD837_04900 [Candidatus Electrothrix sp. GW3-3]